MNSIRYIAIGAILFLGRFAFAGTTAEAKSKNWFESLTLDEKIAYCTEIQNDDYIIQEAFHPDEWEVIEIDKKECDSLVIPTTNPTVGDDSSSIGESVWA